MNIENSKRSWKFSKPETLEFKAKKYGTIGVKNGLFIENDKGIDGIIRKVSFYICKEGFPNTPFRIRIYNLNKENNCPGEDLLTHSVIVSNGNEAGWFTIDLSNYQIDFPIDGAFIMMEWINAGEQYNYTEDLRMGSKDLKTKRIEHWNFYGQTLGAIPNKKGIMYWAKYLGYPWVTSSVSVYVMINIDVDFQVK